MSKVAKVEFTDYDSNVTQVLDEIDVIKTWMQHSSTIMQDWGLENDLFVPKREQQTPMEKGKAYVVFVFLDEKTGRVNASSILDQFLA